MKISQVDESQNQAVLSIEVDPEELEDELQRVYRRVVTRINIPGFRKGKASRDVVERFVGRDALIEDALENLVPNMTSKAMQEKELDVVATPRVQVTQRDPVVIQATYALRPKVKLGDYKALRLEQEKIEITEEQVDDLVETVRQQMGTWEPIERAVNFNDMVTIDVKGIVDGAVNVDEKGIDYVLVEGSISPLPGFAESLKDCQPGQDKKFTLPFPEDYPDTDMLGKECEFTVLVQEAKERKTPELDDDFVKTINMGVETYDELRAQFREDLLLQNQNAADQRFEDLVIKAVIEESELDLPEILIDEEIHHMLGEQEEALRRQQMSMDSYLSTIGKTPEELHEEAREPAIEKIKRTLVLRQMAEDESIEVTDEEIETEIDTVMQFQGAIAGDNSFGQYINSDEGRKSVQNVLKNRKTIQMLVDIAKVPPKDAKSSRSKKTTAKKTDKKSTSKKASTRKTTKKET